MIKVNEFFQGQVKSLALSMGSHNATVGVMQPGDYEFNTQKKEIMTVVAGEMKVQLPGATEWVLFCKGDVFTVPANSKFLLKIADDSAYLCEFVD